MPNMANSRRQHKGVSPRERDEKVQASTHSARIAATFRKLQWIMGHEQAQCLVVARSPKSKLRCAK
jgi:hypothetical protein